MTEMIMKTNGNIYQKYLTEGASKDYSHAMEMLTKVVSQFKNSKGADSTAANQLSDVIRYTAKFAEELSIATDIEYFKTAKDQLTKAMTNVDDGYAEMASNKIKDKADTSAPLGGDDTEADSGMGVDSGMGDDTTSDDMGTEDDTGMKDGGTEDDVDTDMNPGESGVDGKEAGDDDADYSEHLKKPAPFDSGTPKASGDSNVEDKYLGDSGV